MLLSELHRQLSWMDIGCSFSGRCERGKFIIVVLIQVDIFSLHDCRGLIWCPFSLVGALNGRADKLVKMCLITVGSNT